MRKLVALFLVVGVIFSASLVHASYIYSGTVVNIQTYLSIREQPDVNSPEIMRIPNGTRLSLRYTGNKDWWQVLSVNGNSYNVSPGDAIGWASATYIQVDR